jgi:hypothetical protein
VKIEKLDEHIKELATIEPSDAFFINCYLDVSGAPPDHRNALDGRVTLLRKSLADKELAKFEEAFARIEAFLLTGVSVLTRGVALFARGGERPFFLALQFEVPLPNWIAVDLTPNIYHLVELRDNYDRYVILLVTETSARIIGINLGSVTDQILSSRPELRRRVGHEWTKEHFQDHRRERSNQFIHEQVRILARVMSDGGYGHLLLAGNLRLVAAVKRALPKSLAAKLVDAVPAPARHRVSEVVAATLQRFQEHEELDSEDIAAQLVTQIHTHGLAVAGARATLQALKADQADFLVIVKDYDLGFGWECHRCGRVDTAGPRVTGCLVCRNLTLRRFEVRAELARLAGRFGCGIEVVEHSDALIRLGGVGCLLRFLGPASYAPTAA